MALTIPVVKKDNFELLNENIELMSEHLSDQQKAQIAQFSYEKKQNENDKKLKDVLFRANHPRLAKARDFLVKGWEKILKTNWFGKTIGFLKNMASSAMGWLQSLIGIVFLLKSGILQEMVPWLLQIATGLIKTLIKWTPTILKFIWNILTRTIPKLLKSIFNTIFDSLGLPDDHPIRKFFNYIFDNFPKFADNLLATFIRIFKKIGEIAGQVWEYLQPAVNWIIENAPIIFGKVKDILARTWKIIEPFFNKIKEWFSIVLPKILKSSGMKKFLELLEKIAPYLIIATGLLATFLVILPIITTIAGVIGSIIGGIGFVVGLFLEIGSIVLGIGGAIAGVIASIGLIPILIIAGIVAIGVAIFVFRKQIAEFFTKTLPKWFDMFVKSIKNFIFKDIPGFFKKAANFILKPIQDIFDKFVRMFEPISKFLTSMTKIDAGTVISDVKNRISEIWGSLASGFKESDLGKKVGGALAAIKGGAQQLLDDPGKFINNLFMGLKDGIAEIPKEVLKAVTGVFDWMLVFFSIIGDMIKNPTKSLDLIKNFDKEMETRLQNKQAEDSYQAANKKAQGMSTTKEEGVPRSEYKKWPQATRDNYKGKIIEGRAQGGPVQEGQSYVVGEKGAEIFTASQPGNISSNNELKEMLRVLKAMLEVLKNKGSQPQPTFAPMTRSR